MKRRKFGYFPISRRVIILGDETIGSWFLAEADKELMILQDEMQSSRPPKNIGTRIVSRKWASRSLYLRRDIQIRCSICFGVPQVVIVVGPRKEPVEKEVFECLCNCNFSVGRIIAVNDIENQPLYKALSVSVCFKRERYVRYENLIGNDFTPWAEGMTVVVMAYNDFLYDCCRANFDATGCIPINYPVTEDIQPHSRKWRPTYRVLPFCGIGIPKWIKKG